MNDPFATLVIGPFRSSYHNELVNDRFKADLDRYLLQELLPQVQITYTKTEGDWPPLSMKTVFVDHTAPFAIFSTLNFVNGGSKVRRGSRG